MTKETGGAAFPVPQTEHVHCKGEIVQYAETGMTLRDWFAGMALQGLLGSCQKEKTIGCQEMANNIASGLSYKIADAMLKAKDA